MGTRSLTIFKETDGKEICVMYRQFDGYLDGHGKELCEFLAGIKMVNGISGERTKIANGMGCLTAQVIAKFKMEAGGFYIHPAGTRDAGEDYTYFVSGKEGEEPTIEVFENHGAKYGGDKKIVEGPASKVLEYINTPRPDED
jgi:hypothetical protein